MAFVDGDDTTGSISTNVVPNRFSPVKTECRERQVYYVEGKVERSTYNQELKYWFNE